MERLGYEFGTILVTFADISYFASQTCINSIRDTFLVSKKKGWQSLYIQVQSFYLILRCQNNAQVFMTNPCFLKMGLNVTWNVVNRFFEKNMDLSKKIVCCFASLALYIFLKQPCMNVRYFFVNCALFWFWGYAKETS